MILILILVNSAGKRDRICVLFPSDKLLVTNRPKAAAEGSGLRPLSYPRNGRGPLPKAAARAPLGFAVQQKVEVRVAQFHYFTTKVASAVIQNMHKSAKIAFSSAF